MLNGTHQHVLAWFTPKLLSVKNPCQGKVVGLCRPRREHQLASAAAQVGSNGLLGGYKSTLGIKAKSMRAG